MDRAAKADIYLEPALGCQSAIYRSDPRNADAFGNSRHITESTRANVFIDFADDRIKSSVGYIALDLFVPLIILPAVQPCRELRTLFEGQLFDRLFYLVDTHFGESSWRFISFEFFLRRSRLPSAPHTPSI